MKLYPLPTQHDQLAMDTAHRMRAVLAGEIAKDIDETAKAAAIQELNAELSASQQLFLDAWNYLSSDERRTWKLYLKIRTTHVNRY